MAIRDGAVRLWKPERGAQVDRSHPAAQGLQACWLCNENDGGMLYDSAGNFHFILTSGVGRTAEPNGPAVKFDGVSGQGVAAGHPLASATVFTVILRLRQKDGLSNPFGPYLGSDLNFNSGIYIGQNTSGAVQFWVSGSNLAVNVGNDVWGHYAFQWDGAIGAQRTYTNGLLSGSASGIFVTVPAYTNTYIGKASPTGGSYLMDATVSSMKVYNRFLSAAEIAADYAAPYAMFLPPANRRYFVMPGTVVGGGGGTVIGGLSIGAGRLSIGV